MNPNDYCQKAIFTLPYHIVVSEVEKSIKVQEGEAERKPLLRDGMSMVHLLLSSVAWV